MNDDKDLISVILPCYNVDKYVEKAVNSILNQSYKNIEIIAVDDCSTDNTFEILKRIEKEYSNRVSIIELEKNSGSAAHCRNIAMKKAKGKFIGFIDPDDYIDVEYYEKLYNSLKQNNAVIAVTDIVLADEFGKTIGEPIFCCSSENITTENILNCGLAASPCNKLFKAEIIKEYPFLEGKMNEDVASVIPAIVKANNQISYVKNEKYYYVQRHDSAQNSEFSYRRFDMFDALELCFKRIKNNENFKKYEQIILFHQIIMLYTCVIINIKCSKNRKDIIRKFIKYQEKYKIYDNFMYNNYIKSQRKRDRIFYYLVVKLLKVKSANLINAIINIKDVLYLICRKIKYLFKKVIGKNVIKQNLGMKHIIKAAQKQNRLKSDISVSVVIPNYNYERFLYQRLYSILNQSVKIDEIIILDDCSKDNSRELIDQITENIKDYVSIKKVYNKENSGSPFKQWKKGFELATGRYVWIAEADDYCSNNMLKVLIDKVKIDSDIQIAYVDTAFIDVYGNKILKTIIPEIDLMHTGHWNKSFIDNGIEEIEKYSFLNCIIANVSSCIIKNENYNEIFKKISEYRQAGDYLFYNLVMAKGNIAFYSKPLNYYRVHGNNVTSLTKKQSHFDEIKRIHNENKKIIEFTPWHEERIKERYEFLIKAWNLNQE